MRFFVLITFSIFCYTSSFFSQLFDSSNDTLRLIELNDISYELMFINPDSALLLAEEYIKISKYLNDYELTNGLKLKGNISQHLGNSKVALDCYYQILNIIDIKNDSAVIAATYRDIASVHIYMQDIEKAKTLYRKSILIFKKLKNKEIIDSIYYARYIQRALHPDEDEMGSFFNNYVVVNIPKDIVGGDFHWFKSFGDVAIAIAADCTGHGVPGGFLTVLGNLIIETIAANQSMSPNEILSQINQELVLILNQKKDNSIQDGMDLAICVIYKKSKKVVFSGARNGVYIVGNTGYFKEYKGDYTPVGGSYFKKEKLEERRYTAHEFSLKKGDWLFMYTDGYYDQFGGTKNKSMGVNYFKNILSESVKQNNDLNAELNKEFLNWKGNNNQLDDVLVLGFTI